MLNISKAIGNHSNKKSKDDESSLKKSRIIFSFLVTMRLPMQNLCFFHLPKMITFWHPNVKLRTFPVQNFQQFTKLSKTFNEEICLLKLNKSETEISSVDKILGKIS